MTGERFVHRGLLTAGAVLLAAAGLAASPAGAQGSPHGEFDLECSGCHTVEGWTPLRDPLEFEHEDVGRPLEQGHEGVDCLSCHENLIFGFVPTACADCHEDPHRGELGFDCEVCHTPRSWDNRRTVSDFHSATLFPLTGVHATVDCAACHRREPPFEYSMTPIDCVSCHLADYTRTTEPDHVRAGFPTDCQLCHDTIDWNDAELDGSVGFDHSLLFQLTGAHATLDCEECHTTGYAGTPNQCVDCHRADYAATSDPNHQRAGFSTRCEDCHGTSTWEGAVVDHAALFPLTGAHRALDCSDCHASGFEGTPTDCYSCHRDDYNATSDPNHREAGFGTNCESCHTTSGWAGATINHDQFWPLTGTHRGLDCEDCHADGFRGTPTDCYACHRDDYDSTSDPNHREAGFGTNCESCHSTSRWEGAAVNHDQFWPLTGLHRGLDCEECHADGFSGTPTDCVACHRAEYDGTRDPDHDAAGFPLDCEQCHNTRGWGSAQFNHSFPIYSGPHREGAAWDDCSDCHTNPNNFAAFDCGACHSRSKMDDEHDDVSGYVYQNSQCLACHPNGRED